MTSNGSPSDSSELPLIPGGGLSQQGAINWDNIVHRSLTFSVGVLNRCANAGVDPYSLVVGQAVAQNFPLARCGRHNIHGAVTSLQYQNSLADTLWFGFGVRAFVRTLVLTNEGTNLVALCATLAECFHEEVAAEVMFHIVKTYQAPRELTPSTAQWLMVIRACAGTLATSKFPILAEGFMRLDPASARTAGSIGKGDRTKFTSVRGCPLPEDLANVLVAVGKLATGQMESIHVSGCAAVGWVGAIAEWLFDLRVNIFTANDDLAPVYSNCQHDQNAQVYLTFDHDASASTPQEQVHLVQKSYLLPDSRSLIVLDHDLIDKALSSGRLAWKSCLTDTFGAEFERLLKMPLDFGKALGCAARIFKAISKAERGIPEAILREWHGYFDASSGQGFIHNALHWFPELAPLKHVMEETSRVSFDEAKESYEESSAAIQRLCNCTVCRDCCTSADKETFCLVLVMEAIIVLCQTMAGLAVVQHLHPERTGLEAFYRSQFDRRNYRQWQSESDDDVLRRKERLTTMGPIVHTLWSNRDTEPTQSKNSSAPIEARLVAATQLFTGHITFVGAKTSAVSEAGICAYVNILREVSVAPESAVRVNVIPGRIEHDHKSFSKLLDDEIGLRRDPGSVLDLCSAVAELNQISLEVTATSHAVGVSLLFSRDDDANKNKSRLHVRACPAGIISSANAARGLIRCGASGASCGRHCPTVVADDTEYPIVKVQVENIPIEVCDTTHGGEHLGVVALAITAGLGSTGQHLLSDWECVDCCLSSVLTLPSRPYLLIKSLRNHKWT